MVVRIGQLQPMTEVSGSGERRSRCRESAVVGRAKKGRPKVGVFPTISAMSSELPKFQMTFIRTERGALGGMMEIFGKHALTLSCLAERRFDVAAGKPVPSPVTVCQGVTPFAAIGKNHAI